VKTYLIFFALCIVSLVTAQSKIDPSIQLEGNALIDYIVVFETQSNIETHNIKGKNNKALKVYTTLRETALNSQRSLSIKLKKENIFFESYQVINAMRVKSKVETLLEISKRSEVKRILNNINISLDRIEEESLPIISREAIPEWGILKIQADSVWKMGYKGQGIIVGGQDTGYDWKVAPLKQKYRGFINDTTANHAYSWHDAIREKSPLSADSLNPCGFNLKQPCDDNNHGTHTMGTMVGQDTSNSIGVAPAASWMACRNMERGNGQLSTYLECFNWFLAPTDLEGKNPDVTKSPHVINNSWYCSIEEGCNKDNWVAFQVAIKNLKASGVVVVVSAGNSGPNCNTITGPPAFFDPSFSVGATSANDTIAGFSSRGPVSIDSSFRMKPDVAAPGRNVRSVIRGGGFANFSGTSMAGPHVAGLVALIISANPALEGEVEMIEDIITKTADPKYSDQECGGISGQSLPNPIYGYGRINALKAVELALKTTTSTKDDNAVQNDTWSIFPNPASKLLIIENKNFAENKVYHAKIYTSMGAVVVNKSFQNTLNLNIENLKSNLYLVQIYDGTKLVHSSKIVKQ
jgi:serine protease AprX